MSVVSVDFLGRYADCCERDRLFNVRNFLRMLWSRLGFLSMGLLEYDCMFIYRWNDAVI